MIPSWQFFLFISALFCVYYQLYKCIISAIIYPYQTTTHEQRYKDMKNIWTLKYFDTFSTPQPSILLTYSLLRVNLLALRRDKSRRKRLLFIECLLILRHLISYDDETKFSSTSLPTCATLRSTFEPWMAWWHGSNPPGGTHTPSCNQRKPL